MTRTRPATLMDSMREGTSFCQEDCVSGIDRMRDYILLWGKGRSLGYGYWGERGLQEVESCKRGP